MGKIFGFVFILCGALGAQAELACRGVFAKPDYYPLILSRSVSESFVNLALEGRLIHQSDSRLESRDLVVEGGGLCTYTCATNVLHAMTDYMGLNSHPLAFEAEARIESLVRLMEFLHDKDGRLGANFEELRTVTIRDSSQRDEFRLRVKSVDSNKISERSLTPDAKSLNLIKVDLPQGLHALIVLGVNVKEKTMEIADPNFPSEIETVPYTFEFRYPHKPSPKYIVLRLHLKRYGPMGNKGNIIQQLNLRISSSPFLFR